MDRALFGALAALRRRRSPPAFQLLANLIAIVGARRALIAKITAGVVLLALVVALTLPTEWSSSAEVMLDQRRQHHHRPVGGSLAACR